MLENFSLETPLWAIALRGTLVYLAITVVMRLLPKRHGGDLSMNDVLAMVVVGDLVGEAIGGGAKSIPDLFLMAMVVLFWSYAFNLLEYHFPRLRAVVQHTPTLLIHDGRLIRENLRKEKLTEQELQASLRKQGLADIAHVQQAILEVDGQLSVIEKNRADHDARDTNRS